MEKRDRNGERIICWTCVNPLRLPLPSFTAIKTGRSLSPTLLLPSYPVIVVIRLHNAHHTHTHAYARAYWQYRWDIMCVYSISRVFSSDYFSAEAITNRRRQQKKSSSSVRFVNIAEERERDEGEWERSERYSIIIFFFFPQMAFSPNSNSLRFNNIHRIFYMHIVRNVIDNARNCCWYCYSHQARSVPLTVSTLNVLSLCLFLHIFNAILESEKKTEKKFSSSAANCSLSLSACRRENGAFNQYADRFEKGNEIMKITKEKTPYAHTNSMRRWAAVRTY